MDWIDVGGEEMYISNYPPENMKLKIHLFSIPPKSSAEEPVSISMFFKTAKTSHFSWVMISWDDYIIFSTAKRCW